MPYNCCVPQCNSVTNKCSYSFHKLPNKISLKFAWLDAIRIGKIPSRHAKVCSKHFNENDFDNTVIGNRRLLKTDAVPSRHLPKITKSSSQLVTELETPIDDQIVAVEQVETIIIKSETTEPPVELQQTEMDITIKQEIIEPDVELQQTDMDIKFCNSALQTIVPLQRSQLISISIVNDEQLNHFTGFNRNEFEVMVSFFQVVRPHSSPLLLEDEIFMLLTKLNLNLYLLTLGHLFGVDRTSCKEYIAFWAQHMYKKLQTVDFWNTRQKENNRYDVIINCIEIMTEGSNDPNINQAISSTNKSTCTFKALVGCTEYGAVTFVSDLYEGHISDCQIFKDSGILDLLEPGNVVLADQGFDISDLLESKGVILNIPSFEFVTLDEVDIPKTSDVANQRFLLEQINGLAKEKRILADKMPVSLWPLANQIVYLCFMLTAFHSSGVNT